MFELANNTQTLVFGNAIPSGQISQETEFYHREQIPVYSAYTNKEGKWEIKDVEKNNYNIVAEKNEYGFNYLLNQNVEQSIPVLN